MRRINSSIEGFCSCVTGVCARAGLASTAIDTQHKIRNSGIFVPPRPTCRRNMNLAPDCNDSKAVQSTNRNFGWSVLFRPQSTHKGLAARHADAASDDVLAGAAFAAHKGMWAEGGH